MNKKTDKDTASQGLIRKLERRIQELEKTVQDQDEVRVAMLAMLEDLEENRQAIQKAKQEWSDAFDAMTDPIFLHDEEFRIVRANLAYAKRAGIPVQDIIGKPYWEVFPKHEGPLPGCARSLQEEKEVEEEITLETGETFTSRVFTIRDKEGVYVHSIHVLEDITERKQIQTRLCKREAYLRSIYEAEPECVKLIDTQGRLLDMNPAGLAMLEVKSLDDIIGKPLESFIVDKDRQAYNQFTKRILKGESSSLVFEIEGVKGTRRLMDSHAVPLTDEHGDISTILAVARDVTERKQAEQALRESEEKLRTISVSAQDAILMLDDEGRITFWNEAAERIFGYSRAEAKGHALHELIIPESYREAHQAGLAKFAKTGQGPVIGQVVELPALRKDGTEFQTEHSISAVKLRGRWHAIGLVRDITERKQAEEALRTSEVRYRSYIEVTGQLGWTTSAAGEVETDIPAWRSYTGQSEEEVKGWGWIEALHPDDREATAAIWKQAVATKSPYEAEYRVRRHDGAYRSFMARGVPVIDDNGVLREWVGTCIDITERKQAEQILARTNRMLKTLSAGNEALVHATDETALLQEVCRIIIEVGGYRLAWVGYAEQDAARSIRTVAHAGQESGYLGNLRLTWADSERGRGPSGTAIRTGKPFIAQNIQTDPDFAPRREEAVKRGYGSSIGLPLHDARQAFGVLNIYAGEPDVFDDDEVSLLTELSSDLAYGILSLRARADREQLEVRQHESAEKLHQTLVETVTAMSLAVEKRDPYTAGHQQRVAQLAVVIAQEHGLGDERIEGIRLGGIIHDVGKIYIPAEILNRPGKLTAAEFEMIKSHPQVGYDIIKGVDFPWPVGEMILQHHERLDGSGYPQGLKDGEISLEARILAVADVVEAMASHRPYRPGLGIEVALEEIERGKGGHYEPDAVDACIHLFREQGFQFT